MFIPSQKKMMGYRGTRVGSTYYHYRYIWSLFWLVAATWHQVQMYLAYLTTNCTDGSTVGGATVKLCHQNPCKYNIVQYYQYNF